MSLDAGTLKREMLGIPNASRVEVRVGNHDLEVDELQVEHGPGDDTWVVRLVVGE